MIFIANLFKVKVIKRNTLLLIIQAFFENIDKTKSSIEVVSNSYEGLCHLFEIIGAEVDP